MLCRKDGVALGVGKLCDLSFFGSLSLNAPIFEQLVSRTLLLKYTIVSAMFGPGDWSRPERSLLVNDSETQLEHPVVHQVIAVVNLHQVPTVLAYILVATLVLDGADDEFPAFNALRQSVLGRPPSVHGFFSALRGIDTEQPQVLFTAPCVEAQVDIGNHGIPINHPDDLGFVLVEPASRIGGSRQTHCSQHCPSEN
ncbi:hypothetical protein HOE425_331168 [Hoeflea sp. EC-HK425]|nr:hypothetical protein HOE425_331168 [Hoeflea sp. EC-HK425]